ncbi:MAG TPA: hypothetical protein DCG12_22550 [Planctomycetaceae bacterium]|nr:hypothetical protein [Planctomycetaceae bacterium]
MNVLITGSRAPVALDLARRFQRAGHTVFQADSLPRGMAMRSNAVDRSFVIPRPVEDLSQFAASLGDIVRGHSIDVIIPTCEEVFFLAGCRDQLPCRILCDSLDVLKRIHNKWTFSELVHESPVTAPVSHLLNSLQDATAIDETTEDWVFKPVYSRFASRTLVGPSASRLMSAASNNEQWIMQKRIRGTEFSTWSYAESGQLKAHATYRSLYRVGTGSGICFVPEQHEEILEFVQSFVLTQSFTGQIGFDFIQDDTSKLFVLEANPRATSGVHLFSSEDPVVESLIGGEGPVCQPTPNRPTMVEFAMPFWGLIDAARSGRLLHFLPDLLRSRWAVTRFLDPLPTLGLPLSLWQIAMIARSESCSLQTASTFDIEWNGEPL